MRELAVNEVEMISGGNSDLAVFLTVTIGVVAICAISACLSQPYSTYEVVTPLYDPYGNYTGYDRVDVYYY